MTAPAAESLPDADPEKIPGLVKFGWGIGSLGATTVIYVQSLYVLFFFTSILGIEPEFAGTAILAAKCCDMASTILVGRLSDRTRTAWGRRRPFLLAGALFGFSGTLLVFNPPVVQPLVQVGSLILMGMGFVVFTVPYLAMPAEMTSSPTERIGLISWRVVFLSTSELLVKSALPLVAVYYGGGRRGYGAVGLVAALLVGVPMLLTFLLTARARGLGPDASQEESRAQGAWRAVLTNRRFMLLMCAKIPAQFGLYVHFGVLLFFFTRVIGDNGVLFAVWGLSNNLLYIASIPLWVWLSRRLHRKYTYIIGQVTYVFLLFSWLLAGPAEPLALILLRAAFAGPSQAAITLASQSMLPDSIQYDTERSGVRREGTYAAAYNFVEKSCGALAPFAVGWVLQNAGLSAHVASTTTASTPAVLNAFFLTVAIIPGVGFALALIPLALYPTTAIRKTDAAAPPAPMSVAS